MERKRARSGRAAKGFWLAALLAGGAGGAFGGGAPSAAPEGKPPLPPLSHPRGAVVASVDCLGTPGQSYALYLPSGYTPERSWPIVYAFDARSAGAWVAELFRAGAERYGFILASSNTSASDRFDDPNPAALSAMWRDTHARFAVDDRRVYLAGMSGTVRAAVALAHDAPGVVTGVIGAAAGWPFERKPDASDRFLFYGTTAFGDYNYYEVLDLEKDLGRLGVTHHVELFEGVHQWMPAELATRALGWLELQAMKAGSRAKEAGWIETQWQEALARARGYEAAGDLYLAEREYRAAAADFSGLRETAEAAAKGAEVRALPAFQKDAREREKVEKAEKAYLERARGVIALISPENGPATAAQIAGALQIADLKKRARSPANVHDRWSAKRLLATLQGQTASYLPTNFMAKKEYDRAILALSIALEINESNAYALVNRAQAHASKGDRKRALADLERAAELGWKDAGAIEGEEAFAPLRGDAGFQKVLARMRQGAPPPAKGEG